MIYHQHLIITAHVRQPFVDPEVTKDWLKRLVAAINMKICKSGGPHVDYVEAEGNCGIAGVVMIETSHISIHCWDKQDPPLAQIDVYSCNKYDNELVLSFVEEMDPIAIEWLLLDRQTNIFVPDPNVNIRIYHPDGSVIKDTMSLNFSNNTTPVPK